MIKYVTPSGAAPHPHSNIDDISGNYIKTDFYQIFSNKSQGRFNILFQGGGQNFDRLPRGEGQSMKKTKCCMQKHKKSLFSNSGRANALLPSPPNDVPDKSTN